MSKTVEGKNVVASHKRISRIISKKPMFLLSVTRLARLAFVHSGFAQRGHNVFPPRSYE